MVAFKGYSVATHSVWVHMSAVLLFRASALCSWHSMCQQAMLLWVVPGHSKEPRHPLLTSLGWWQPARLSPTQGQAIPDWSKPFQAEPSGCLSHIGPDRCQLSRCSAGANRVTSEGYWRQEQLCSDTVFTPDSPLDTSVTTRESQRPDVRLLPQSLLPPAPRPSCHHLRITAHPGTCTQGKAQFPWVSRATGATIKRSILGWDVIWWADLPTPP